MVVDREGRYMVRYQFYVVPPYWVVHPLVASPGIHLDTFLERLSVFSRNTVEHFLLPFLDRNDMLL